MVTTETSSKDTYTGSTPGKVPGGTQIDPSGQKMNALLGYKSHITSFFNLVHRSYDISHYFWSETSNHTAIQEKKVYETP